MRKAKVFLNGEFVGVLAELRRDQYTFSYNERWFADGDKPAISLTLPKSQQTYQANYLFPFFFNLLSEGVNRQLQCRYLKIDEKDDFGLLLATATTDTIGAVTVQKIND